MRVTKSRGTGAGRNDYQAVALLLGKKQEIELVELGKFESIEEGAFALLCKYRTGKALDVDNMTDKEKLSKANNYLHYCTDAGFQVEYDTESQHIWIVKIEKTEKLKEYALTRKLSEERKLKLLNEHKAVEVADVVKQDKKTKKTKKTKK